VDIEVGAILGREEKKKRKPISAAKKEKRKEMGNGGFGFLCDEGHYSQEKEKGNRRTNFVHRMSRGASVRGRRHVFGQGKTATGIENHKI